MVRRTEAKITALLVVGVSLILCFVDVPLEKVGICRDGDFYTRLTYHFFHVSLLHWFANAWCVLSLFFIYDMPLRSFLTSVAVASLIPMSLFPTQAFVVPSVGLSGICFFLMGRVSLCVQRKVYYQVWLLSYLVIGFLFPGSNGWLHLYCYMSGVFVGFINKPLI